MPEGSVFTNDQLPIDQLPSIDEIDYQGLHKDYLYADLIGLFIVWVLILTPSTLVILLKPDEIPGWIKLLVLFVLLFVCTSTFILKIIGFRRKKYAMRERDILYKEGVIWRSSTIVPFNRVQHAEVHQGPIERLFKLSKLKIYTAGGSSSDLSISGLSPSRANQMKHYILDKTSSDEEE